VFRKDDRAALGRKELFKNTLKKAAHAWKRVIELRLSGEFAVLGILHLFVDLFLFLFFPLDTYS